MQFTSTAFVAGFAGVFLLLSRFGQAIRLTGFVLFTIVALLLRKEVFIPVLAFAGVAMWHQVRLGALRIRPVLFAGAAVLLVYLLAWGYNDRDPAYAGSGYYPYHRATDVICNLPTDTAGYDLSRLGWTPNDLSMLGFWFWTDDQVFAADKIITFARETKSRRTPQETIRYGIAWAKEEQFAILVILLAAGFILVTSTVSRAEKEFVFINLLLAAALLTYLVVMARVPKRVSTPILFYQALVCLLVIITGRKHAAARLVWLGVVTLVCVYKFGRVYQLSQQKNQKPDLFTEAIRLIDRHPQDLFLVVSKGLPLDQMPVFQKTHDLLPHHNLLLSGWLTYLPAYNQLLKIHGLKNLSADLIGRKNIVLVNGNIRVRETLTEFYREHYGTGVEFIPYEPAFPNLPAYRFVFQDLPKTPAGSP